jgi:hypothetical protein
MVLFIITTVRTSNPTKCDETKLNVLEKEIIRKIYDLFNENGT